MINRATLLGRVGSKENKPTKNDSFLCKLSIATEKKWMDSSGFQQKHTTWHLVNCFDKKAEIANKYVNVGDLVYIEGEINNRKYDDNGVNRIHHSITAQHIELLPNAKKDNDIVVTSSGTGGIERSESHAPQADWDTADIPF